MSTKTANKKKKRRPTQPNPASATPKTPEPPKVDWTKPTDIDDVRLAFPAQVMGTLLPSEDDIPESKTLNPWRNLAEQWFYHGLQGHFVVKPHISTRAAARHLRACLGSYEPRQEHKIAGVAYLMSLWFDDFEPDNGKYLGFTHVHAHDKAEAPSSNESENPRAEASPREG